MGGMTLVNWDESLCHWLPLGSTTRESLLSPIQQLSNMQVDTVSLGYTHTLVIERRTGHLFGFGDNGRGQVTGCLDDAKGTNVSCSMNAIGSI